MACSNPDPQPQADDGFATPAAVAICLAMAVIVTAVTGLAVSSLKQSRADLARHRAEYSLAGARLEAVQVLVQSGNTERVRWSLDADGETVEVIAEPEPQKLSLNGAAHESARLASGLDAADPPRLARTLEALAGADAPRLDAIAQADGSALWRLCARSLVSTNGALYTPVAMRTAPPAPSQTNWRAGQLWRLRLTDQNGWTDDSVVRFTGAQNHPAAVTARRFFHSGPMGDRCDSIVGDAPR